MSRPVQARHATRTRGAPGALASHLGAVFALALAVRLGHAGFLSSTPFFRGPIVDALVYHQTALAWAHGGEPAQPFYQPPLAALVLSWLYRVGVELGWGVAAVQSIAGALTCALLVLVGRRVTGELSPHVGLTSGLAAALCGPFVLYDLEMLAPVWVDLLLATALALSITGPPRASLRDLGSGLALGAAAIGWVPSLIIGPALAWARSVERGRAVVLALVVLGAALPLAWTAHHNAKHGAPGVLVSWNGGLNLWLGNNPEWRRTWRARPGAEFEPLAERARRAGATGPAQEDRFFRRAVLDDVREHPWSALARTTEKLYYAWHGRELRRNQDFEILRDASPVLATLQWELGLRFPFGLLAPLALVGMWRRRHERTAAWLALTALVYSVVLASFFVATRYRLPLVMLVLPFAADTALRWAKGPRPRTGEIVLFGVLLLGLNLPSDFTASIAADTKERAMLEAQAWRAQGRLDEVERISRALLHSHPDDPNVQMLHAQVRVAQGRCDLAMGPLERVTQSVPLATTPLVDLASCHVKLGRTADAERAYARALSLHPNHPGALRGAAVLYQGTSRGRHAIVLLERLQAARQNDDGTDFDLARLYVEDGRADEALALLQPIAARRPGDAQLQALLARARAAAGSRR